MKKIGTKIVLLLSLFWALGACSDYPVDEDGLLITTRTECYVSNFELLDTDMQTVKIGNAYIDTIAQVAIAYVKFGTPLNNLWPQISLCEDAKVDPKITGRTDFTPSKMDIEFIDGDWSSGNPTTQLSERIVASPDLYPDEAKRYTVISGTRDIRKEYVFLIVERPLQ